MAARVMGNYTSGEGIAVAVLTGGGVKKPLHTSWHPSLSQPDGTHLYPAEELQKLIQSLQPDTTILFDVDYPVAPLSSITLPRLRPQQVYQALKIELESRTVTEVMDPVAGFCPGYVKTKEIKKSGLVGFGLAIEASDLRGLRQKHRSLGMIPDLVTLPIIPLTFTFIREVKEDNALLYLIDGPVVMMAVIGEKRIKNIEVFYGGEEGLIERLSGILPGNPELKVYGFEAGGGHEPTTAPSVASAALFTPLEGGQEPRLLAQLRRHISRITLAILLARLPSLIGSIEYGGIHAADIRSEEQKAHWGLQYAAGLLILSLLGIGTAAGVMGHLDRRIYQDQRRAMKRVIKSVLPNAPPVAATTLIEAKLRQAGRLRGHLSPMLTHSTLELPASVLPILDKIGRVRVLEVSALPDSLKVIFESSRPLDAGEVELELGKVVGGNIELMQRKERSAHLHSRGLIYTLNVVKPARSNGVARVE